MSQLQAFLDRVETFLAKSGTAPTALGKAAVSDPNFVFDLREGRIPSLAIVDRVEKFIREQEAQPEPYQTVNGRAA